MNPDIHVYKIKDVSGRTRVVHRNLLLEVNFLPLPALSQSEDAQNADQDVSDCASDLEEGNDVSISGPDPDPSVVPVIPTLHDPTNETLFMVPSVSCTPSAETHSARTDSGDSMSGLMGFQPCPSSASAVATYIGNITDMHIDIEPLPAVAENNTEQHNDMSVKGDISAHTDSVPRIESSVRTCAGRLVKSVNRLSQ